MNKLACSAIVLSLTSTAALASDGEWSSLEQEVNALTSTLNMGDDGATLFGRVRTYLTSQTDGGGVGMDTMGWDIKNVRLGAKGKVSGYGYKVQVEFKSGAAVLLDAYSTFNLCDTVKGTMGKFKAGVSRSSRVSSGRLLFTNRSVVSNAFKTRTEGFKISGELSRWGWEVSAMNGQDGTATEVLLAARVEADLMGGGLPNVDGAYGGSEDPALSAAVAVVDDGVFGEATLFELVAGTDLWSFGLDMCDAGSMGSGSSLGTAIAADTTPISIQGSYMLQPETWELGVRFQDLDNGAPGMDSTTVTDVSINRYINGHSIKWMLNGATFENGANDNVQITAGLQVSF